MDAAPSRAPVTPALRAVITVMVCIVMVCSHPETITRATCGAKPSHPAFFFPLSFAFISYSMQVRNVCVAVKDVATLGHHAESSGVRVSVFDRSKHRNNFVYLLWYNC